MILLPSPSHTSIHEDRMPTHGYEPTREAAMVEFANSAGGGRSAVETED
jgi:hypothetical protein